MSRKTIAPTLTRCLPLWIEHTQGTRSHREAKAELRALLACAEALTFALKEADERIARMRAEGMTVAEETRGLRMSRAAASRLARLSKKGD